MLLDDSPSCNMISLISTKQKEDLPVIRRRSSIAVAKKDRGRAKAGSPGDQGEGTSPGDREGGSASPGDGGGEAPVPGTEGQLLYKGRRRAVTIRHSQ